MENKLSPPEGEKTNHVTLEARTGCRTLVRCHCGAYERPAEEWPEGGTIADRFRHEVHARTECLGRGDGRTVADTEIAMRIVRALLYGAEVDQEVIEHGVHGSVADFAAGCRALLEDMRRVGLIWGGR